MEWSTEIEETFSALLDDFASEYWASDQGVGQYDPDGRKMIVTQFVKNLLKGEVLVPSLHYDISITPIPEHLRGRNLQNHSVYTVLRFIEGRTPQTVKTFDPFLKGQNSEKCLAMAEELIAELTEQANKAD